MRWVVWLRKTSRWLVGGWWWVGWGCGGRVLVRDLMFAMGSSRSVCIAHTIHHQAPQRYPHLHPHTLTIHPSLPSPPHPPCHTPSHHLHSPYPPPPCPPHHPPRPHHFTRPPPTLVAPLLILLGLGMHLHFWRQRWHCCHC